MIQMKQTQAQIVNSTIIGTSLLPRPEFVYPTLIVFGGGYRNQHNSNPEDQAKHGHEILPFSLCTFYTSWGDLSRGLMDIGNT
jgi:hypothetical protein